MFVCGVKIMSNGHARPAIGSLDWEGALDGGRSDCWREGAGIWAPESPNVGLAQRQQHPRRRKSVVCAGGGQFGSIPSLYLLERAQTF